MNIAKNDRQSKVLGFSLIEILVALALGSLLMLSLWQVHAAAASTQQYRQGLIDLTVKANLLHRMLLSRAQQAGFWGYRHIAEDYPVTNWVCPSLLGTTLAPLSVINSSDGQHLQFNYLDNQVFTIDAQNNSTMLVLKRTTAFSKDTVIGIGDLSAGWVTKVAQVSQKGETTQLNLAHAIPDLSLPAVVAVFHGMDESVSKVDKVSLGLWEQTCDSKRGLIFDNIKAWQVLVHINHQGFANNPMTLSQVDGFELNVLLQSEMPILIAPMRYVWLGQATQSQDRRFYLPLHIIANLGQVMP